MHNLQGKVVVVTGGSGLLGQAFLKSVTEAGGTAINADLKSGNNDFEFIACNISKENSVKALIKTVLEKYDKIDGWINNAYPRTTDWGSPLEEVSLESWNMNLIDHLSGYFLCSKLVLEQMKLQASGSLINMGSIYGIVGPDFTVYKNTEIVNPVAYSAIKGGIINLTRYLASYYGRHQVRVNAISPGGIFENQNPVFVEQYEHKVPLQRMGRPEDIAPAAAFLLSDSASYITGHNLVIDGGWTIV